MTRYHASIYYPGNESDRNPKQLEVVIKVVNLMSFPGVNKKTYREKFLKFLI